MAGGMLFDRRQCGRWEDFRWDAWRPGRRGAILWGGRPSAAREQLTFPSRGGPAAPANQNAACCGAGTRRRAPRGLAGPGAGAGPCLSPGLSDRPPTIHPGLEFRHDPLELTLRLVCEEGPGLQRVQVKKKALVVAAALLCHGALTGPGCACGAGCRTETPSLWKEALPSTKGENRPLSPSRLALHEQSGAE